MKNLFVAIVAVSAVLVSTGVRAEKCESDAGCEAGEACVPAFGTKPLG